MMGAKSQADELSGPAEPSHPHQKAEDMTAPETFTVPQKRPLTTGRRPDMTAMARTPAAGSGLLKGWEATIPAASSAGVMIFGP